jgi:Flp pilus assembly protein CpaB
MKNRRALTFAIGLGVLSFLLLFFYVQNMDSRFNSQYERIKVIVATRDILQNEIIDETMVEIKAIPKPYVQPLVATAEEGAQVIGYSAATTIKKGEQVLKTKLNLLGEAGIFSDHLPKVSAHALYP